MVGTLTILYDSHCGLCRHARGWLERQPKFLPLEFLAAASPEAVARFPTLDAEDTLQELTVVSEGGGVYRGENAWLMCLYALRAYRGWSLTFARPFWRPVFRLALWLAERLRGETRCEGACQVRHTAATRPRRRVRGGWAS